MAAGRQGRDGSSDGLGGFQPRATGQKQAPYSLGAAVSFGFALSYPRKQQRLSDPRRPTKQTPAAETARPLALLDDFATESNSPSSKLPPTVLPPRDRQDQAPPRDKLKLLTR